MSALQTPIQKMKELEMHKNDYLYHFFESNWQKLEKLYADSKISLATLSFCL